MTSRAALLSLALAALTPAASRAQFTTYVAPPQRTIDSAKAATVAVQRARTDSAVRATITNMKEWVDSAAGVTQAPPPADSIQVATRPAAATAPPESTSATFSTGAVAPATASYLPMIALLGLASLSVGIVLFAGRGRA